MPKLTGPVTKRQQRYSKETEKVGSSHRYEGSPTAVHPLVSHRRASEVPAAARLTLPRGRAGPRLAVQGKLS